MSDIKLEENSLEENRIDKKKWLSDMPSNIALIKYMGKTDFKNNRPTNTSFSYTLNHLKSFVELTLLEDHENKFKNENENENEKKSNSFYNEDRWACLEGEGFKEFSLTKNGEQRFLSHLQFLKKEWGLEKYNFLVKSNNSFPQGCGLASSASSFAALTMATYKAAQELKGLDLNIYEIAQMSQKGSGSSCRSFFQPWSVWSEKGVSEFDAAFTNLLHQVIVVDATEKKVSSSKAHKEVLTSSLFKGRPERANLRFEELTKAFHEKNWKQTFEICWSEFWDMHTLFETSNPHFNYMTSSSLRVLREVEAYWQKMKEGPIVTMDAGANVHLLYKKEDEKSYEYFKNIFSKDFKVIGSNDSL